MRGDEWFVIYRGDDVVDMGTAEDLAARRGVKTDTIRWMSTPSARRRDGGRREVAVRVEMVG